MEPTILKLPNDPIDYKLTFDFNQLCDAELETGINLMGTVAGGHITAGQTRAFLYACLKTAHPQVELAEAGQLLSRDTVAVLNALGKMRAIAIVDVQEESSPAREEL